MSRDVVLAFTIPLIVYKTGNLLSSKPSNVKAVDWMPQNDILGHAKTRLFLSHVGHNSMYEAAYHGVPVIGFPMWSDQPENARQDHTSGHGALGRYQYGYGTGAVRIYFTSFVRVEVCDPKTMNIKLQLKMY